MSYIFRDKLDRRDEYAWEDFINHIDPGFASSRSTDLMALVRDGHYSFMGVNFSDPFLRETLALDYSAPTEELVDQAPLR